MSSRIAEFFTENRLHPIRRIRSHFEPEPDHKLAIGGGVGAGVLILLALVGVAWYLFGADLRRYIKIKRM